MRIKSVLILAIVFSLASCTNNRIKNDSAEDPLIVDWSKDERKPLPEIKSQDNSSVGPVPNFEVLTKSNETKALPVAMILGPGLYRTLSYISLLKELEISGHGPHFIMGHGLAAVIAAYYAFGYKADFIEWKFFKFINEAKEEIVFSREWVDIARKVLIKELEGKRIEEGLLTLAVPIYNYKKKEIKFLRRGDLSTALIANLDHKNNYQTEFGPAFPYSIYDKLQLEDLGLKRVLFLDSLSAGITWVRGDGLLNGLYEKGASISIENFSNFDFVVKFPLKGFKLDSDKRVPDLVFQSKKIAKEKLKEIIKRENNNEKELN